jgi:hypothetical protein
MNEFKKKCPKCECQLFFKSEISLKASIKKGSVCRKCASSGEKNGMFGKTGKLNPFFEKKHTKETLEKQSKVKLGKTHSHDSLEKMKGLSSGDKNGMFGKSFYEIWVNKYGIDIANEKLISFKSKQSKNNSGENNPMFGKPSPTGSGNGWSGWYKGWYFRSLRELTYMIKVIERFDLTWECGEQKKYKIKYITFNGNQRNYFPDFIINGKYIVESKPKRLWGSDSVNRKKEAAIKFCGNNGLKYKLVDVGVLNDDEIKKLYNDSKIKFLPKYEEKFKIKLKKDEK